MQGVLPFSNLQEMMVNICVLGSAPPLVLRHEQLHPCCCETPAMTWCFLVKPAPNLQDCISKPMDTVASFQPPAPLELRPLEKWWLL